MSASEKVDVAPVTNAFAVLQDAVGRVVVGQERPLRLAFLTFLCSGHSLFEGVPGVAKTLLVRTLARTVGLRFGRVQFTPDLMPSDITGTPVLNPATGEFRFRPGPLFADLLLADEINRASAKTQAALLEAMQERAVTVDGTPHPLGEHFTVFATQNPVEQEGTYPLPEAELDRFLFKIEVGYPSEEEEQALLTRHHGVDPAQAVVETVIAGEELAQLRSLTRQVIVREEIIAYVAALVRATRADVQFALGASPRAGLMLVWAAKAHAAVEGRDFVIPEDVQEIWSPALCHRVVLDPAVEVEGGDPGPGAGAHPRERDGSALTVFPARRALVACAVWTGAAVVAALFPALLPLLLTAAGVMLAVMLWDALLLGQKPAPELQRRIPERATQDQDVDLCLAVTNRASETIVVDVIDELPTDLAPDDPSFANVRVGSNRTFELSYTVRPAQRGDRPLGRAILLERSPLGFWRRRIMGGEGAPLRVYPDARRFLGREALNPDRIRAELGIRPFRQRGEGMEFDSLREYVAGDDPRRIDWAATARRGRAITRLYQHERNHTVVIAVDTSRLMAARCGSRTKLDHAVDAALALGLAALSHRDRGGAHALRSRIARPCSTARTPRRDRTAGRVASERAAPRRRGQLREAGAEHRGAAAAARPGRDPDRLRGSHLGGNRGAASDASAAPPHAARRAPGPVVRSSRARCVGAPRAGSLPASGAGRPLARPGDGSGAASAQCRPDAGPPARPNHCACSQSLSPVPLWAGSMRSSNHRASPSRRRDKRPDEFQGEDQSSQQRCRDSQPRPRAERRLAQEALEDGRGEEEGNRDTEEQQCGIQGPTQRTGPRFAARRGDARAEQQTTGYAEADGRELRDSVWEDPGQVFYDGVFLQECRRQRSDDQPVVELQDHRWDSREHPGGEGEQSHLRVVCEERGAEQRMFSQRRFGPFEEAPPGLGGAREVLQPHGRVAQRGRHQGEPRLGIAHTQCASDPRCP